MNESVFFLFLALLAFLALNELIKNARSVIEALAPKKAPKKPRVKRAAKRKVRRAKGTAAGTKAKAKV